MLQKRKFLFIILLPLYCDNYYIVWAALKLFILLFVIYFTISKCVFKVQFSVFLAIQSEHR